MEEKLKNISASSVLFLFAKSRPCIFLASIIYVVALVYCLSSYASIEWPEYGFSFRGINILDAILLTFAIFIWSLVVPKKIDRPSSLFLIITYLFVCIPGGVAMVGLKSISEESGSILLLSLALSFAISCLATRIFSPRIAQRNFRECSNISLWILLVSWTALLFFLIYSFGSIMSFATLDNIYAQRGLGSAQSLLEGYAQTYFGYVISPTLLALGLVRRRYFLIIAGVLGAIILYSITAEKAVFMYPFFIIGLFFILRSRARAMVFVSAIAIIFAVSLLISVFFYTSSSTAAFVSWYLGIRSLLIPGSFIVDYSNYFGEHGYTFFSHISGLNLFIDTPTFFLSHPRWPSIGYLIGEDYFGVPLLNANANFIASDGVASMGAVGIFVILFLFTCFLIIVDKCSHGITAQLTLPLFIPLALDLTNGSLFTAMTSFGGVFLLCWLYFGFE